MTKLSPEYLERQPEEISRILVLSLLDDALAAAERLGNPHDTEALHDFRVALRRLRSGIRDYRPYLKDSIPKKVRKELRSLASSTNTARDAEVQLAWLNAQSDKLNESEHKGFAWLVKRFDEKDVEPYPERFERVMAQLARIRKTLTKNLSSWKVYLDATTKRDPFKAVIGSLMQKRVGTLSAQLREIRTAEDNAQAHAARISAKRLRYLVEPIGKAVAETTPLVERLKELQDSLGDLHDTNLLIYKIGTAMEASAIESARRLHLQALQSAADAPSVEETPGDADQEVQPGLLALARLLRNRRQTLFVEIESRWHGNGLDRFVAEAHELGGRLRATPGNEPSARRFRLNGLPERLQDQSSTLVEEGWLPGKEIEDCICRERSDGSERHYRLVRVGTETRRTRIALRVFATLWPLTDGRRSKKDRYEVIDGDRVWRVDDLGENVVLAETEGTPGEELQLPDWLIPCLREELTGPTRPSPPASARTQSGTKQTAIGEVDEPSAPDVLPAQVGPSPDSYPKTIPSNGRGDNGSTGSSPDVHQPPAEPERKR